MALTLAVGVGVEGSGVAPPHALKTRASESKVEKCVRMRPYITAPRRLGYPRCMLRLLPSLFVLLLLPSCTRSAEDSCAVICEKSAICQPGTDEKSCASLCNELAAEDAAYTEAIARQADCYEENASYYDEPTGVCLAIEGGACNTIQE